MKTGAEIVIEGLERAGAKILFGIPGGAVLDIYDKLYDSSIHFILARHEQGATHMADGFARASGRVGCCLVTSGPGATNTVTGIANAYMDGIPLVCITGQVPSSMIGNDAFQEADTIGITRPITKHSYLVRDVNDLPRIMVEAFYIASTGKPGPVVIDLPKDIQKNTTDRGFPSKVEIRGYKPVLEPHPKQIARLAEAINASTRPVLYAGGGVIGGNAADELTLLARKAKIPVTTTLMGLGSFPEDDELSLKMLGMHGTVFANKAVSMCDLLIAVGARFDDRVTGKVSEFAPHARIAHIDIDSSTIGKTVEPDIPVVGDVKLTLKKLIPLVKEIKDREWLKQIKQWKEENPLSYDSSPDHGIAPQYIVEQVYDISKGNAIIVTDVGQHQMWAAQYFKYTRSRTFLSSGGLGTMGFGLPAAIGAQLARPKELVILFAGDGSIQMNFQELVVAVEHELPIKVIIFNNGYLGMVRQWQEIFYKGRYSASRLGLKDRGKNENIKVKDLPDYLPDFVKLAEAHGAVGIRVEKQSELRPLLKKVLKDNNTTVIEVKIREKENVYPMVPPGASLLEMIQSLA